MTKRAQDGTATVEMNGSEILIRIQAPAAPESSDRLIRLDRKTCQAEGLEVGGLKAKVDAGELPSTTLGRSRYVRMSDVRSLSNRQRPVPAGTQIPLSLNRCRRTGGLVPFTGATGEMYYRGRIRLADGSREWIDVPERVRFHENASRSFVTLAQAHEDARGEFFALKQPPTSLVPPADGAPQSRVVRIGRYEAGLVYVVEATGTDRVKIGWTSGDMAVRLKALQSGAPFPLVVRATTPGTLRDERAAHRRLAADRVAGTNEWFHRTPAVEVFIAGLLIGEGARP